MGGGRVATALADATKEKRTGDKGTSSDDAISSSSSANSSPSHSSAYHEKSSSSSSSGWQKRITRNGFLNKQLEAKMKHLKESRAKRQTNFQKGCCVSTKHSKVAPLEDEPRHDGARKQRIETFGLILDQSPVFPEYWLIQFFNGKTMYCTEQNISFCPKPASAHHGSDEQGTFNFDLNTDPRICNTQVVMSYITT